MPDPNYFQAYFDIFGRRDLCATKKALLSLLRWHQGGNEWAWPTQKLIREELGISKSRVTVHLRALKDRGFLIQRDPEAGERRSDHYHVITPPPPDKKSRRTDRSVSETNCSGSETTRSFGSETNSSGSETQSSGSETNCSVSRALSNKEGTRNKNEETRDGLSAGSASPNSSPAAAGAKTPAPKSPRTKKTANIEMTSEQVTWICQNPTRMWAYLAFGRGIIVPEITAALDAGDGKKLWAEIAARQIQPSQGCWQQVDGQIYAVGQEAVIHAKWNEKQWAAWAWWRLSFVRAELELKLSMPDFKHLAKVVREALAKLPPQSLYAQWDSLFRNAAYIRDKLSWLTIGWNETTLATNGKNHVMLKAAEIAGWTIDQIQADQADMARKKAMSQQIAARQGQIIAPNGPTGDFSATSEDAARITAEAEAKWASGEVPPPQLPADYEPIAPLLPRIV